MKTETLIHRLAMELQPVKPIGNPVTRFLLWSFGAIVFMTLTVGLTGIRPDILTALVRPSYILRLVFMLGIALLPVYLAFRLSVPAERRPIYEFAPVIAISAFLFLFAYLFLVSEGTARPYSYYCVRNVFAFSIPIALALYFMLRRAAPLRSGMIGMMAALGSVALSSLGTQLICRSEGPLHILVSHFVPVLAACVLGIFLGRWIFRWERVKQPSEI